jgi:hypothetical protein
MFGDSRSKVAAVAALVLFGASIAESVAVAVQARGGPKPTDWTALRLHLEEKLGPEDGLTLGARWLEPLARHELGDALLSAGRLGTPAETWPRFAIVAEPGFRQSVDAHVLEESHAFGSLVVHWYRAREPFRVLERLQESLSTATVTTSNEDHEVACSLGEYGVVSGNLGSGPAWPSKRFFCAGTSVARAFVTDTDYRAHDAIYMDVPGDGRAVVVRYASRAVGTAIRGGVGLYVEAEREGKGAPVVLEWLVDGRTVGTVTHRDGEGWKAFEFPTAASAGAPAKLEFRVKSPGGTRRLVGVSAALVERLP